MTNATNSLPTNSTCEKYARPMPAHATKAGDMIKDQSTGEWVALRGDWTRRLHSGYEAACETRDGDRVLLQIANLHDEVTIA